MKNSIDKTRAYRIDFRDALHFIYYMVLLKRFLFFILKFYQIMVIILLQRASGGSSISRQRLWHITQEMEVRSMEMLYAALLLVAATGYILVLSRANK